MVNPLEPAARLGGLALLGRELVLELLFDEDDDLEEEDEEEEGMVRRRPTWRAVASLIPFALMRRETVTPFSRAME